VIPYHTGYDKLVISRRIEEEFLVRFRAMNRKAIIKKMDQRKAEYIRTLFNIPSQRQENRDEYTFGVTNSVIAIENFIFIILFVGLHFGHSFGISDGILVIFAATATATTTRDSVYPSHHLLKPL